MDQVQILWNLRTNKIVTLPVDKPVPANHTTIAVVPKDKVDISIGYILGQNATIGYLAQTNRISDEIVLEINALQQQGIRWAIEKKIEQL